MSLATEAMSASECMPIPASGGADTRPPATLPILVIERIPGWHLIDLGEL